jgi:hypothetical protein
MRQDVIKDFRFLIVNMNIQYFVDAFSLIVYLKAYTTCSAVSRTSSKVKLSLFRKMRGLEGEAGRLASQVTRAWKRLVIFYDGPPLGRCTQKTAHHGWIPQICFFYSIVAVCCGSGSARIRIQLKGKMRHQSDKLDPDPHPHQSNKLDLDPHQYPDDRPRF